MFDWKMSSITKFLMLTVLLSLMCVVVAKALFPNVVLNTNPDEIDEHPSLEEYQRIRQEFINRERNAEIGSQIELNANEEEINQIIMSAKRKELDEGLATPHLFKPSQNFYDVVGNISETDLYKLIQKMPKGGVLHAHDSALCSTNYLLNLTHWTDLWTCQDQASGKNHLELLEFKFSLDRPSAPPIEGNCNWILLADVRKNFGEREVDEYLRGRFRVFQREKFIDGDDAWKYFKNIFGLLRGLLTYEPIWKAYYKNALMEFDDDGVQYLEFRTTLPALYALDGTYFPPLHTAKVYHDALQEYLAENPSFIGSKFIYAPSRWVNSSVVAGYLQIAKQLKKEFPDFFAGFDLVSQEDKGPSLLEFLPQLLNSSGEMNFYFHAGETNWYGTAIDENLVDAVLLGTKRIGHGYALIKHSEVLKKVKSNKIAIEICPISNQVLQLVHDLRNHPSSHFFASNYSVVISSDDPSFWGATPLSHDFYIAFLGIASAHSDLRLLKQLIMNSIDYSAMNLSEKIEAFLKWEQKWKNYVRLIKQFPNLTEVWNELK